MSSIVRVLASLGLLVGLGLGVCAGCDPPVADMSSPTQLHWTGGDEVRHEARLPHRTDGAVRRAGGTVWYEATFDAAGWTASEPMGVVVLADMHVADVRWPESLLALSPGESPTPHHWNRPLLFVAPAPPPAHTTMTLQVETAIGGHGGIRILQAGPLPLMQQRHRRLRLALVTSAEMATAAAALFALLMMAVWIAARQNRLYLDFALVCALFAVNNLGYHVFEPPLPFTLWDGALNATLDAFMVALHVFTRRLLNRPTRGVTRAAWAYVAAACLVPALVPAAYRTDAHDTFHFLSFLWGLASFSLLIRYRRVLSPISAKAFIIAGALFSGIGVHDLMLLKGLNLGVGVPLIHFGAIILVSASFAALIGDLVRVLQLERTLTQTLERRVAEKTTALEQTHRALVHVEKARAMSEERERLSRELHDGTAGQLVTLLAMLENTSAAPADESASSVAPPLGTYVRQVIDDLRLTIQSIDPTVETLGDLLGTLRPYLETQAQASGITLQWYIGDAPDTPLSSDVLHGVQRIVQEAVTNVVRHARATEVVVHAQGHNGGASIAVADDGTGIAADAVAGRGRSNMSTRTAAMNGSLSIEPGETGGTTLTLQIPQDAFGADAPPADIAAEDS